LAPKAPENTNNGTPEVGQTAEKPVVDPRLLPPVDAVPYWPHGCTFDMHVYLSTLPVANVYAKWSSAFRKDKDEGLPHFIWKDITYGNYKDHRVANFDVKFPEVSMSISFHLRTLT